MLAVVAGLWLWRSSDRTRPAGHRTPITQLGYCGPNDVKPCILAFNLDSDGSMRVNVLTPASTYPNFHLTISREAEEYRYECKKAKGLLTRFVCTGQELFPGELLQFRLVSIRDDKVLAAGSFTIIGLMIATPDTEPTETGVLIETGAPTESPTPFPLEFTPAAIPTATPTPDPSYPNPSYPNPSYPSP